MSRGFAVDLPEALDLFHRQGEIARNLAACIGCAHSRKVQRCVEQRRRMARGEYETIAIWPRGIHGVVAEEALPQTVDHRRKTHGGPRMARICLLHGIDCESADGVNAQQVEVQLRFRLSHYRSCGGQEGTRWSLSDFRCTGSWHGLGDFTLKRFGTLVQHARMPVRGFLRRFHCGRETNLYCPELEVRCILFVGPRFGGVLKSPSSLSFRRNEATRNLLFPWHSLLPRCCSGFSVCVLFERARRTCYFSVSALPGWRNGRR